MWDKIDCILRQSNPPKEQKDLAAALGVRESRVSKWKTVKGGPRIEEVAAIARALEVRLGWLVDDDAPDDPRATGLPSDEQMVLKAYRKFRGVLEPDEAVDAIAEARGRKLQASAMTTKIITVPQDEPAPAPAKRQG